MIDRAILTGSNAVIREGIHEQMFHIPIGADRCWADLVRPDGDVMQPTGFVICHAFGLELLWLHRIERRIARALAKAGFPVLAIHRRGSGDSTGDPAEASVPHQSEDILTALDVLAAETGVTRLGLIAPRFGSVVAASVLAERPIDRLMLMNPVLSGRTYVRGLLRDMSIISLAMGLQNRPSTMEEAVAQIERDGVLDVLGQPLFKDVYDELMHSDVSGVFEKFGGDLLLCQISKSSTLSREMQRLGDAVTANGGRCVTEVVKEPVGASFGHSSQIRSASEVALREAMHPVEEALALAAVRWMEGR